MPPNSHGYRPLRPTPHRAETRPGCAQGHPAPSAWAESRTKPQGSRPRRSAPTPTAQLAEQPGHRPSESRAAARHHLIWGSPRAEPARGDTNPVEAHPEARRASARRRTPRPRPTSSCRRRPHPGSCAPASTPPTGRHSCGYGHTTRGNDAPGTALHMHIACAGVLARPRQWPQAPFRWTGRRTIARRGRWVDQRRPCPNAYLRDTRDQSRGPSLPARCSARRSQLLRPPRTPADLRSPSPSAYRTGLR